MKPIDAINWNLYCIKDWELSNLKLTELFNQELQQINLVKNSGRDLHWKTAKTLWKNMIAHFKQPEFKPFGTQDSDAKMALREAIEKTLGIWLDEHLTSQL